MSQETLGLLIGVGFLVMALLVKLALDRWRPVPEKQESEVDASGLDLFKGIMGAVGGLAGCLAAIAAMLGGLFVLVWLVKRMWEAA